MQLAHRDPPGAPTTASGVPVVTILHSARPLVCGILNVTPDSFSDGGRFFDHDRAAAYGFDLACQGADLIDIGGESTRPGAEDRSHHGPARRAASRRLDLRGRSRRAAWGACPARARRRRHRDALAVLAAVEQPRKG
jgi:hypothetical protein